MRILLILTALDDKYVRVNKTILSGMILYVYGPSVFKWLHFCSGLQKLIPDVMLTVIYFVVQLCIALVFHITFPHLHYTTFS